MATGLIVLAVPLRLGFRLVGHDKNVMATGLIILAVQGTARTQWRPD
jgi:hypothetical protein